MQEETKRKHSRKHFYIDIRKPQDFGGNTGNDESESESDFETDPYEAKMKII